MARIFNLPNNKTIRRNLRKQEIGAESKLWYALKRDQLGFRFRRQYGVGRYIVDFYCPRLKLAIEVDGATHSTDEEIKNDKIRQEYLESLSLTVKRYTNTEVYESLDLVVENIRSACWKIKKRQSGIK